MSKINILLALNSYADSNATNSPSLNHFRWARDFQGIAVDNPQSSQFSLAAGESKTLFSGTRSLQHDNSTQYSLSLKAGATSTYVLQNVGGTAPQFRTSRTTGADATTEVTITQNGNVFTFASTGGTLFSLISGGVTVGDQVQIGNLFSASNQGIFMVISITATSFSIQNPGGVEEGPITLGAGFANQIKMFSSSGVQKGDTLRIFGGFSQASWDSYEITQVTDDTLNFSSTKTLPQETVTTDDLVVYSESKRILYLETDKKCSVEINGDPDGTVEPIVSENGNKPGMMFKTQVAWSMTVTNDSLEVANLFFASAE